MSEFESCPACGGTTLLSLYIEGEPLPHRPGCVYDADIVTCGDCKESWTTDQNDRNIEEALVKWEKEHPNLARYMTLLGEHGEVPHVGKVFRPRPVKEIEVDLDETKAKLTEEECRWIYLHYLWLRNRETRR